MHARFGIYPMGKKKHHKTHLKHLISIQYQVNRVITGAYKATSALALDVEAYTIPIQQKLDWLTSNALLHMVSRPVYAKIIDSRPKTQTYLSPLETLTNCYERTTKGLILNIEQILPFTAPPC